jgi:hypothetical protein
MIKLLAKNFADIKEKEFFIEKDFDLTKEICGFAPTKLEHSISDVNGAFISLFGELKSSDGSPLSSIVSQT